MTEEVNAPEVQVVEKVIDNRDGINPQAQRDRDGILHVVEPGERKVITVNKVVMPDDAEKEKTIVKEKNLKR